MESDYTEDKEYDETSDTESDDTLNLESETQEDKYSGETKDMDTSDSHDSDSDYTENDDSKDNESADRYDIWPGNTGYGNPGAVNPIPVDHDTTDDSSSVEIHNIVSDIGAFNSGGDSNPVAAIPVGGNDENKPSYNFW